MQSNRMREYSRSNVNMQHRHDKPDAPKRLIQRH